MYLPSLSKDRRNLGIEPALTSSQVIPLAFVVNAADISCPPDVTCKSLNNIAHSPVAPFLRLIHCAPDF